MGQRGRRRVEEHFTFAAQARQYQALFERLTRKRRTAEFTTEPSLAASAST